MKSLLLIIWLSAVIFFGQSLAQQTLYDVYDIAVQRVVIDSAKNHLRKLYNLGLYDSVLVYCSQLRSKDALDYNSLELALATAYYYKGNTATAYQYAVNGAEYTLKLNGGGGNAFTMIEDYQNAYPLASDTVLEKIIVDKVSDYYLAMDYYTNPNIGLKLLLLSHKKNKMEGLLDYLTNDTTTTKVKEIEMYTQVLAKIENDVLNIIENNGGFYTVEEVGPAWTEQLTFAANSNSLQIHQKMLSFIEKDYRTQKISSIHYVNALVNIASFKEQNAQKLEMLRDSLCNVFDCGVMTTIITENGDTLVLREEQQTMKR